MGWKVRRSRAFPGTSVFLKGNADELKALHLIGNFLENAQIAEGQSTASD